MVSRARGIQCGEQGRKGGRERGKEGGVNGGNVVVFFIFRFLFAGVVFL